MTARRCHVTPTSNAMPMPMDDFLQDIFVKATNYVKSSTDKLDSTRLLYLYARYKQVKVVLQFPSAFVCIYVNTLSS